MKISSEKVNKVIVEALTNRTLYNSVKANYEGFDLFYRSSDNCESLTAYKGLIDYINATEFNDFNSIEVTNKLRNLNVAEGTLSDLLNNLDYLRSVNAEKLISAESMSLLKQIFFSGHFSVVNGKSDEEIFNYCHKIDWIDSVIDPRFKIENISSSEFDTAEIAALLSPTNSIKSSMPFINESSPNGGFFPNELITVSAAPGTGKTQYCFTEALNFIRQGKKIMYIALGDMVNYMITIRLMCMYAKISPKKAYLDLEGELDKFRSVQEIIDGFNFVCLDSGTVSSKDVFNFLSVKAMGDDPYDVYMVDYDGNFAPESESMYQGGGTTYDRAINVCRNFNKLGFILSQPKLGYYGAESLGIECLAESSRKQQITDTIVTFGIRQGCDNKCGLAQIVKGRNRNVIFRVPWAQAESGQLVQIDQDMYAELTGDNGKIDLILNDAGGIDLPSEYLDAPDSNVDKDN
jgi:hypothetical protein